MSRDPTPVAQMWETWIGISNNRENELGGQWLPSRLGALTGGGVYGRPPIGVLRPYRQPQADLVKPFLFCINGAYFSVYGDTQVAGHVPIKDHPERLAALRYAGALLFAYSQELPPALQSCGVDGKGLIWLADLEGHMVFFDTARREFVRAMLAIDGVTGIRIPRGNPAGSLFALAPGRKEYREHLVQAGVEPRATPGPRTLPAEIVQVLYCDERRVVYLTPNAAVAQVGEQGKPVSQPLPLAADEKVMEGVYLPASGKVAVLVAKKPDFAHAAADLFAVRQSWQNMRVVELPTPLAAGSKQ